MIAGDGFDRDISRDSLLSDEEVRELLRDVPDAAGQAAHEGPQVLFISRRGADAALLGDRLVAAGAALRKVRNPFAALDQVRLAPPGAVVTDLELWAEDGALLFDRLRRLSPDIPVLFLSIAERNRGAIEARLRRRGAWGVLFQPLEAGEAESAALRLVEAARRHAEGAPANVEEAVQPPPEAGAEDRERSTLLGFAESFAGSSRTNDPASGEGELSWLRFHFHLSRAMRSAASRDDCAGRILEAVCNYLRPRAVGISCEHDGRVSARLEAATGAGLEALESLCSSAGPGRLAGGADLILLFEGPASSGRLVIVGLPPAIRAAASAYVEDVRTLVTEGLAR